MCFISRQMRRRWRSLSEHCIPPVGVREGSFSGKWGKTLSSFLSYYMFTSQVPIEISSPILHQFDVEIPCKKFVEITSILKGECTWKLWHPFDVDISTCIQLSKSMKYRWVLHLVFFMSFRRQIDVISVLAVSTLLFSNIFCCGNLF